MRKKPHRLEFISMIKRDGSGTEPVPDVMLKSMLENRFSKDRKYKLMRLSLSQDTYIASGFNSFVVRLKPKKQ
jgi:hypothetical protein